jgi:uncharacterized SAM-binding protein YcdF (DUF218 family)
MLRRFLSLLILVWLLAFLWFAIALPRPQAAGANGAATDAAIVLTGGPGRVERGIAVLAAGRARLLLVSGVDRQVKPAEFRAQYTVPMGLMRCCITLGFDAFDTRSNANETTRWVAEHHVRSLRLITNDWHMRRAAFELRRTLPRNIAVIEDAVPSHPTLRTLFLEYNKLLLRLVQSLWER